VVLVGKKKMKKVIASITNDDIWLRVRPAVSRENFNANGGSNGKISDVIIVNLSKRCLIPGFAVGAGSTDHMLIDRPEVD